jgi:FKBP-type peptidyl-prolyl cis-trans isomerase
MADTKPSWDATRVFTVIIVIMFFISSFTVSALVIWELLKKDNGTNTAATSVETTPDSKKNKGHMLQGTKLQNFTPVAQVDKLQVIDLQEGTGEVVKAGDTVTAHYTGALAKDGTIFQSSLDTGNPATFPLDNVIKGWQEGVPGMKEGGKRRLVIPAADAYGNQAQSGIPANSDLVFDIELKKIEKQ